MNLPFSLWDTELLSIPSAIRPIFETVGGLEAQNTPPFILGVPGPLDLLSIPVIGGVPPQSL
jgi:hypothetical protein